jgi:hypothetical protein
VHAFRRQCDKKNWGLSVPYMAPYLMNHYLRKYLIKFLCVLFYRRRRFSRNLTPRAPKKYLNHSICVLFILIIW